MAGCSAALCLCPLMLIGQSSIPPKVINQHRALYAGYKTNTNLTQQTLLGKDVDVGIAVIHDYVNNPAEDNLPAYPNVALRRLACGADAIIVAIPVKAETAITSGGDFLFTDSLFHVDSVTKGALEPGNDIVVTRPGGQLSLNGHSVRTEVSGFPQFQTGRSYLLFLKYLPDSKSYQAFRVGSFTLAPVPAPIDASEAVPLAKSVDAFLTEVRAAATAPCAGITPALQ